MMRKPAPGRSRPRSAAELNALAALLRNMPATFEPRLDILPESQRLLWPNLDAVPSDFVLYGGTALALQLGHRVSEDFDFFSSSGFDPDRLRSRLPFFRDLDPSKWKTCGAPLDRGYWWPHWWIWQA